MYYRMTVAGLERDLPICPLNDKLSIAGFVIFGDQELTVACARDLLAKAPQYDYIITAEAKGIPLAHEMARQAGDAKYILPPFPLLPSILHWFVEPARSSLLSARFLQSLFATMPWVFVGRPANRPR